MDNLKYKTYTFPQNPTTYEEKMSRTPIYYLQENGLECYGGMSEVKRIITGTGAFCGHNAFSHFLQLMSVFELAAPGELVHPIWGSRHCYFTALELTQDPREDYVAYKFTFTCALEDNSIPA